MVISEMKMATSKMTFFKRVLVIATVVSAALTVSSGVNAATSSDLDKDAKQALQTLYKTNSFAKDLSKHAKAILVFPNIVKAGLVFGGSYGEGVLLRGDKAVDYYNSVTGSWGLQAGAQSYGYTETFARDFFATTYGPFR